MKKGYIALFLDKNSKEQLLLKFPPRHENLFADHITLFYNPSINEYQQCVSYFDQKFFFSVMKEYEVPKMLQCCEIECELPFSLRKNSKLHITISTSKNIRPVQSNQILKKQHSKKEKTPILENLNSILKFIEFIQ